MSATATMSGYDIHPAAAKFPLMDGEEFKEFEEHILEQGLLEPIKLDSRGLVVDGRNRLRVCSKHKIQPRFEQLPEEVNVVEFIVGMNLRRRHLNPSQLALLAHELSEMELSITQEQAAVATGASIRQVQRAAAVVRQSPPEVVDAVREGNLTLHKASREASKPAAGAATETPAPPTIFVYDAWKATTENSITRALDRVPGDMRSKAIREIGAILGTTIAPPRRHTPEDGDILEDEEEASFYSVEDYVARIDKALKAAPVTERKDLRHGIGVHYLGAVAGKKCESYLPPIDEDMPEADVISVIQAEFKARLKEVSGRLCNDSLAVLKGLSGNLAKQVSSLSE